MGGSLAAAAGAAGRCWRASTALTSVSDTVKTLWLVCLLPGEMLLLPCLRRSVVTATLQAAEKKDSFHRKFCRPVALQTAGHAAGLAVLPGVGPSKSALWTAPKL